MKKFFLAAALALAAIPMAISALPQNPTSWTYYTVDVPGYANTVITGVSSLDKVTAYAYNQSSGSVVGMTAQGPSFPAFSPDCYPNQTHCIAAGLANFDVEVGHYQTPQGPVAWIHTKHGGYKSLGTSNSEFLGNDHILCLQPVHGTKCNPPNHHADPLSAGFLIAGNTDIAIEYDSVTKKTITFNPPGAVSAIASTVNGHGDVAGSMVTASGLSESWLWTLDQNGDGNGTYYEFAYPGAVKTTALGLNWQYNIVGCYLDTNGKHHGFFMSHPTSAKPTWITIDEPNSTGDTCVYGINSHQDIVGDYTDATGVHGFYGTPNTGP